jgi:hypothetical protein
MSLPLGDEREGMKEGVSHDVDLLFSIGGGNKPKEPE